MVLKLMIIEMIYNCVLWINDFPPKGGVSSAISPHTLLTGVKFDYNCHCKLPFGAYAQVHEETFQQIASNLEHWEPFALAHQAICKEAMNS